MDVDENLKQTYIQYDPAPRKGNEVLKKRVPDYFLWSFSQSIQLCIFHWRMYIVFFNLAPDHLRSIESRMQVIVIKDKYK